MPQMRLQVTFSLIALLQKDFGRSYPSPSDGPLLSPMSLWASSLTLLWPTLSITKRGLCGGIWIELYYGFHGRRETTEGSSLTNFLNIQSILLCLGASVHLSIVLKTLYLFWPIGEVSCNSFGLSLWPISYIKKQIIH